MLVGLLAKLVALVLLVLAAVGVFVGGQKFVSLLDKSAGPAPPVAVRTVTTPPPSVVATPQPDIRTPRRGGGDIATIREPGGPPGTASPQPRPARGALRPVAAPRTTPPAPVTPPRQGAQAPPTQATAVATQPPKTAPAPPPAPTPAPTPDPTPVSTTTALPPSEAPPDPTVLAAPLDSLPTGVEAVLIDLQLGRLVSRTVVAYRDGDEALVPVGAFFDLAEIRFTRPATDVIAARLEPSGTNLRVAAGVDSLVRGKESVPVDARQLLFMDGELFLATDRLGALFNLNFDISWPDLTVTVLNPDSLPAAQRIRRDQMRMLLADRGRARPDTIMGGAHTKWDGLVLDYNLAFPISDNLVGGSAYQFSMGGQAAGGALQVGIRSLGSVESGATEFAATWRGVWIDNKYVKQLSLGTATLTGPRYTGIRGVSVTNSPYIRPSYVGQLDYYGRLEPGWELEAYSGAQLVAFDSISPGGDYSITLPVGYGENPVDFVAYGPYGQVRRFNQTYRVVSQQLPYRQFEYGIAAGECVTTLCDGALNADLHYGLSRRVTVRGGVEGYTRDSLSDVVHPYALATGLVGNALTLEGEVVGNGWVRGAARVEPSLNLRLAAGYSVFDQSVERSVIAPMGRRSQWLFDAFLRPVPSLSSLYIQAMAEIDGGVDFDMSRGRVQASVQADGVRLYPYVRFERMAPKIGEAITSEYAGLSAYTTTRPSWGPVLGNLWFRGDLEAGGGEGMNLAALSVAKSFGPELRIEVGAGWHRNVPGTTFKLSLVSYLPTLQATTTAIAPTEGGGGVLQTVQGTVVYDRNQGRVTANPNPGIQRSGVSGTVFIDENANGTRDPGEPGAGDIRVTVGSYTSKTDSLGQYHVWDVPAFEPVLVQIDTTSLDNPLYVPAFTTASLQPPPNAYRPLDLPLVTGAVLEGRVVQDGAPVPGLTLVLTNQSNGKTTSIATFSDGSFYVLGVKPGQYTIQVDARDLVARGLTGTTLHVTAQPDAPDQLSNLVVEVRSSP